MFIAGERLPKPIYAAAVVPFNNSFLLVGGGTQDSPYLGDIYQYNAADGDWLKMETELKTPRRFHVALLVEQSLFPQCPSPLGNPSNRLGRPYLGFLA